MKINNKDKIDNFPIQPYIWRALCSKGGREFLNVLKPRRFV